MVCNVEDSLPVKEHVLVVQLLQTSPQDNVKYTEKRFKITLLCHQKKKLLLLNQFVLYKKV